MATKLYKVICPSCKKERNVTYSQYWNIETKKSSGKCQQCVTPVNGEKTRFRKRQKAWNKGLKGYMKGHPSFLKDGGRGANNPSWKGGITPINARIRKSDEYKLWRTAVFKRDSYTCIWCGYSGTGLHADHIKPFSLFPELRFAIDNGRTLCKKCHLKTSTWGGRVGHKV